MLPLFIHVARLHKQQQQQQQQLSLTLLFSLFLCELAPVVCIFAHFSSFAVDGELQLDSMLQERLTATWQHQLQQLQQHFCPPLSAVSLSHSPCLSLSLTPNFWLALPLLAVKRDFFQINFSYIYVCLNFSTIFFQSAPATHHTRAVHVSCVHVCVCACVYVYQIRNCTLHAPHSICGI